MLYGVFDSVTRWVDYFSIFGHLCEQTFAQWHRKFSKIVKNCKVVNETPKICPSLFEDFAKMAKFRTNLVTLVSGIEIGRFYANVREEKVTKFVSEQKRERM